MKKPLLVYHGTNTKSGLGQKSGFYPGTYTSKSKEVAQGFGENVETLQVDSSKIFPLADADDLKRKAAKAGFGFHGANGRSEANYLKSHGYIGMARGNEVILFPFKKQSVRSYIAKNLSAKLRLRELARGDYAIPAVEAILGRKLGAGVKDALRNRGQRIHTPPPEFVGKKLKSEAEAQLKGKGLAGERQVQYTDVVPTLVLPDRFRPSRNYWAKKIKENRSKNLSAKLRLREFSALSDTEKAVFRHYYRKLKKQTRGGKMHRDIGGYLPGDQMAKYNRMGLLWRGTDRGELETIADKGKFVSAWTSGAFPKDFESAKLRVRELALGAGTRIRHIPLKERRLITQKLRAAFPGEGAVQGLPRMIRTEKGGDMILSYRAASQKQRLVFPHSHLANPADPDALMAKELRKSKGGIKVAVSNRGHQVAPQDASIGTTTSRFFVGTFGVPYLGVYATPISKIQSRVEVGKYGFPNLNATKAGFNRHWESEVAQPNGGNIIAVRESVGRNEVAGNPEEIKSQFGRRNRRRVSSRQEEIVIPRGERGGRDKFVEALAKRNNKQLSAKLRLRELARSGRLVEFGAVATKTNPDLWAAKVAAAKRKFGKWSARASQWAVREYKSDGGGYRGKKSSSNSMAKWTRQKWRTRDGDKAERTDSAGRKVVARYLPDAKWKRLSPGEAAATDTKKRKASREGKQVVANTDKAKVRELSERLVELARVQSVTGQILNINPVPRKVADPILRSLRRKLEKGGDKQAVRGVFGVSRPQRASMPVFNHATGTPSWAKVWNPVKPKLVEIDGKKSILHYRGADAEDSLRVPRHDTFVLSGEYDRSLASEGLPKEIRQKYSKSAKSRVKLKQAGIDNEGSMRSHISQNTGGAISTSVNPSVSREYLTGKEPVFGVYATSLNDLIRNQQRKTGGSIVNNAFPFEQEITQVHGNNLLKTRPYKLDGQRYTRQLR